MAVKLINEYFSKLKKNDWIYPGHFNKFGIDLKDVYIFLSMLQEEGLVQPYLEAYCPNCARHTEDIYETLDQITDEVECEQCDTVFNPRKHVIVIYKVIADG